MNLIDQFYENKQKALPKSGFNVVSVDDYDFDAPPVIVAHTETREEAEKIRATNQKQNPGTKYYVYDKDS